MANNLIILGILFCFSHGKAVEILTAGLPFIANYGSSFNAHIINHDVRTPLVPVQTAPILVQPTANQILGTFPTFARFTTNPIPIVPQALKPVNPVVQQQPTDLAYKPNDERNESIEVEATQRNAEEENESRPLRLEQQRKEESDTNPRKDDISNPAFFEAQFLARNGLKATPTSVPHGFIFHSRSLDDQQGQFQENQRAKLQRVRVAKIQRIPIQEKSPSDQTQEIDDVQQENGSRKSQNVRPNIYSQFVTF